MRDFDEVPFSILNRKAIKPLVSCCHPIRSFLVVFVMKHLLVNFSPNYRFLKIDQ